MKIKSLLPVLFTLLFSCDFVKELPLSWERRGVYLTEMKEDNEVHKFYYNSSGRVTHAEMFRDGKLLYNKTFTHDGAGRVINMTAQDPEHEDDNYQIALAYNALGQIEKREYVHQNAFDVYEFFEYDSLGRVSKMTDVYKEQLQHEEIYTYQGKTVTVDFTSYTFGDGDVDQTWQMVYTFDGKRSVYSTSDALKCFDSPASWMGAGFPWSSYLGNVVRVENKSRGSLVSLAYIYNKDLLPQAGQRVVKPGSTSSLKDIPLSFAYATESTQ